MDTQSSSSSPDTPALVYAACDGCGSSGGRTLLHGPDRLMGLGGTFRLVRCESCNLVRQDPHLAWEALQAYYPLDYLPYQPLISGESPLRRLDRRYGMRKRLRALQRLQPTGSLLDVGCGTGVFLGEAQRAGSWRLEGLEPSAQAADCARASLSIPVHAARFEEADLHSAAYDVITMWNVLEHLEHPIQALGKVQRLLKPGGWLVFTIPSLESPAVRLFGRFWLGWDLPRHLYLFPRSALELHLEQLGFRLHGRRCLAGSHAMFGISLGFALRSLGISPGAAAAFRSLYNSLPARLLLAPFFFAADRLKLCSLITWFVQKPG